MLGAIGNALGNVAESLVDTATEIGVAIGVADKEPCGIVVDDKTGQASAQIDYSDIPQEHRASVRANADALATAVSTLKEKLGEAKADGASPRELAALTSELEKAQGLLTDFKFECEINGMNPLEMIAYAALGPIGGAVVDNMIGNDADLAKLEEMNQAAKQFEAALGESKAGGEILSPGELSPKEAVGTANAVGLSKEPTENEHLNKLQSDSSEGSSKTSNDSGNTPPDGASDSFKSGAELYDMMKSDPEAFMEYMKANPEAGNMLMDHMQTMNRMFTTMSNIMKAEHDTQKAMINNFRV